MKILRNELYFIMVLIIVTCHKKKSGYSPKSNFYMRIKFQMFLHNDPSFFYLSDQADFWGII